MFKLESYIVPILLSYVDKYIRNFKPQDAQVSLWGGDASFQNLDLRLEVLEHELKSPFTFISGHIRELLIHVPWTKLTSEPITITINTIECVLTLREPDTPVSSEVTNLIKEKKRSSQNKQLVETPPNYVQLLINKIVSNIQIFCNNLILKYVEEDVVLSMNIRHLKLQSCNDKWEAAYTELSPTQVIIRKLITINDLTICLDKRNASGKIEVYQEPILYKCSLRMHFLRSYLASTANKSSLTRLDIYCQTMKFSISDQQVPMIYRLIVLLQALQQKKLKVNQECSDLSTESSHSESKDAVENSDTWTNWAWSYVSAVLPTQWEEDNSEQFTNQSGHIVHIGYYIDWASIVFKIAEMTEKSYQKKIRHNPILSINIQGIYAEMVMIGLKWLNTSGGINFIFMGPVGPCTCSYPEIVQEIDEESTTTVETSYLTMGKISNPQTNESLFDMNAPENKGSYRFYNSNWDHHFTANTAEVLLEKSPAIAFDYVYNMIVPDDVTSEMLSEAGSNYEFSNFQERSMLRFCIGSSKLSFCSGLYHRILTLIAAASVYDYPPYYVEKPDPKLTDLLPPSEEDFDALTEFIPTRQLHIMIYNPVVELHLMDHPDFEPTPECLAKKPKKVSTHSSSSLIPKVTLECSIFELTKIDPMYINRLVHTTCQLPEPPEEMFNSCYSHFAINVVGISSRLLLKSTNQTTILVPFNLNFTQKTILKSQYWVDLLIPHQDITFAVDNLTINGTNPKFTVISDIIRSILNGYDKRKTVFKTSLLFDAAKDYEMPYLEVYIEKLEFRKIITMCTTSLDIRFGSIKAFLFETLAQYASNNGNEIEQVLLLSGPEKNKCFPLINLKLQCPLDIENPQHPPIVSFNSQEMKICMDPLLFKWLLYYPVYIVNRTDDYKDIINYNDNILGTTTSETSRKISHNIESIHSSSDIGRNIQKPSIVDLLVEDNNAEPEYTFGEFIKKWHTVMKLAVININLDQLIIFFPTESVSAVGSQGVEEAMLNGVETRDMDLVIVTLPKATIQSSHKFSVSVTSKQLPIILPNTSWDTGKSSFPWTLSISDLNVFTYKEQKTIFTKPISLSATVSLSTKNDFKSLQQLPQLQKQNSQESVNYLGIYVHIDMPSIFVHLTSTQIYLLTLLAEGQSRVMMKLFPVKESHCQLKSQESVTSAPPVLNSPPVSQLIREQSTHESTESASIVEEKSITSDNELKVTAWVQWTITKFHMDVVVNDLDNIADDKNGELMMRIEIEDIVTSLDYQDVYLKLRGKMGVLYIRHYKREQDKQWEHGIFGGFIVRLREDVPSANSNKENGFISVTLTRASSQHTHHLWGTDKKTKKDNLGNLELKQTQFITEIVINIQPIDIILPPRVLMNFIDMLTPFQQRYESAEPIPATNVEKIECGLGGGPIWFTNRKLPLAYLDCQSIRIMLPASRHEHHDDLLHNVLMMQINKIALNPVATNPICRTPIRPDIYRHAAQARILNIPGSELEDRQYQLDITGIGFSSINWSDLKTVLGNRKQSTENPAVEWNKLEQGQNIMPILNVKHICEGFDINIVAAPAMFYKSDTIICGCSLEVNLVTDITIQFSSNQLVLLSLFQQELKPPKRLRTKSCLDNFNKYETYLKFRVHPCFTNKTEVELSDFYKDSGIDTSDIHSVLSSKCILAEPKRIIAVKKIPLDFLITAGKITAILYEVKCQSIESKKKSEPDESDNSDASFETAISTKSKNEHIPIILFQISQPNIFYSSQLYSATWRCTIYDINIKTETDEVCPAESIPSFESFNKDTICTKVGTLNPITGIPPSFLTLQYVREIGKTGNTIISVEKPVKLTFNIKKIVHLLEAFKDIERVFKKVELKESLPRNSNYKQNLSQFKQMRSNLQGINSVEFTTSQIVLVLETESNNECSLNINKIKARLTSNDRPEKIVCTSNISCFTFKVNSDLIINPWNFTVIFSKYLDSWQFENSEPFTNITFNSDCLFIDVCPYRILWLQEIIAEFNQAMANMSAVFEENLDLTPSERSYDSDNNSVNMIEPREQHYKDDLRAGAFQFVEVNNSNVNELPLPYQVVFSNHIELSAMAWRYPHPRTLTKIRVFPVPFDIVQKIPMQKLQCHLQYWSEYRNRYVNYIEFYLSESEVNYLTLPKTEPIRAVASVWRVLITAQDITNNLSLISPKALAACMRIDSYFNPNNVPKITSLFQIQSVELRFASHFNKNMNKLPLCLQGYKPDSLIPECHTFANLKWTTLCSSVEIWNPNKQSIEISGVTGCKILDYQFLRDKTLIKPFKFEFNINKAKKLSTYIKMNDIALIFGPNYAHSLAVNTNLWIEALNNNISKNFIIITNYVICNDLNVNIRFQQSNTDEDILLLSKQFHTYCWRSEAQDRKLQVAIEDGNWLWSKPFYLDYDGIFTIPIAHENNFTIIVTVESLSATQKQITISGQLTIANMLLEHFEFKIIPDKGDKDVELKKVSSSILNGKSFTPSMCIDYKMKYFLRLRFYGLDSAWTGDIPLRQHVRDGQPWLVKVPLQERGQFLSIWCRIAIQDFQKTRKILAMLWPLFTVKSNLPISSKIHIFTPTLNVHLDSEVHGKGKLQQLYCPGTFDHSHQLTFKLDDGTPISEAYVPLNYSLVDQEQFFKKNDKENIDEIVKQLKSYEETDWPYFGKDWEEIEWTVEEQPQTSVQVRYKNTCPFSSALLVEILPWCLIANTCGSQISILANGTELCKIPHYGIVAPPRLEDTFHLGIDNGLIWCYTNSLQLAKSDWSQTFYMPTISGTLPMEGQITAAAKYGSYVWMVSLSSSIYNDIRLLMISSMHLFTNRLKVPVYVACLAVPVNANPQSYQMPHNLKDISIKIDPNDQKNTAFPITRWLCIDETVDNIDNVFYVSIAIGNQWSCPIRVDAHLRRSFSVSVKKESIPLVFVSHKHKGQIYLSLFYDDRPQTFIENHTELSLLCGQAPNDHGNVGVENEAGHFKWYNKIKRHRSVYYTMPAVSQKFPELPNTCFVERISFACAKLQWPQNEDWSTSVSITTDSEQFVRIPNYGDVRLLVKVTAFATLLSITPTNQVEFSAMDIRGRLTQHERGENDKNEPNDWEIKRSSISIKSPLKDAKTILETYKKLFQPTLPINQNISQIKICTSIKSFAIIFISDNNIETQSQEIAALFLDRIRSQIQQDDICTVKFNIADIQFDNHLYTKEPYDFPVSLYSRKACSKDSIPFTDKSWEDVEKADEDSLFSIELLIETIRGDYKNGSVSGVRDVIILVEPISCYIEDVYITRLAEYFKTLVPKTPKMPLNIDKVCFESKKIIKIPEELYWESKVLATPLNLRNITVEPLSILLSVHCSVKMYIALDQSPLEFGQFIRRRLLTTHYRLGHAMTMHYLSGAIFGAGWVVSSLELLGSPSGLARAMGTGLRDFINLPYQGLFHGPTAFLVAITQGSASLMKHVTAGTLQSVTKLASSVARNLDRLTLDEEHMKRAEEQRRVKPKGVAEGFKQGLTGLGISLLGAVGGIAHHPLQSLMSDNASPRSVAAGLGLGLVGVITKPLSGAAELVALTGQGLLQGAGWNPLPQPRLLNFEMYMFDTYSHIKYKWKLLPVLTKNLLGVIEGSNTNYCTTVLLLTNDALITVDAHTDKVNQIVSLSRLQVVDDSEDSTLLSLKVIPETVTPKIVEDEMEMDPACRARVADYVRTTATILQINETSGQENENVMILPEDEQSEIICFYVDCCQRNYFLNLLHMAKLQLQTGSCFPVLE